MLTIKVWCLPEGLEEKTLQNLFWRIVSAVVGIEELGLKDEKDMTILFPPDRMRWGLGEDIVIEIGGLNKPERTEEVRNRLAKEVGWMVKSHFPSAYVKCFVQTTFDPKSGFWASARP